MNRQKKLLSLLLVGLALSIGYAYRVANPGSRSTMPGRAAKQKGSEASSQTPLRLNLALLEHNEAPPAEVNRDIFNFKVIPPPPPPPPPKIEKPLPPPPPVVQQAPPTPQVQFNFLGLLDKEGTQVVFLSSGQELFLARPGDRFGSQNQYLLRSISDKQVVIEDGEGTAPILLNIEEPDVGASPGGAGIPAGMPGAFSADGGAMAPPAVRPRFQNFRRPAP
jgi:hypothetical protein